jgi:flagellar hook-length control protein FliK
MDAPIALTGRARENREVRGSSDQAKPLPEQTTNADPRMEAPDAAKEPQGGKSIEIGTSKAETHQAGQANQAKDAAAKGAPTEFRAPEARATVTHGSGSSFAATGHGQDASGVAPKQPTAPTAHRQFLPPQAPMSQLEGSVRWLLRSEAKGAELQLHPENLGRVTVHLKIDGTEVHAKVWATEASTMPMLREHKTFLESSLKEQGLTLSSFDLQHGKGGHQAQGEADRHHQHFAPPMRETWTGTEFRQEMPTQLVAQHVDESGVEVYA